MHNNLNEIPIFLYCLRSGLIIGIMYDIFRIPRRMHGGVMTGIADTLFALLSCGLAAVTLLICDSGKLRLFSLFGIGLGAVIWQLLPGRLLRSCAARISLSIRTKRAAKKEKINRNVKA